MKWSLIIVRAFGIPIRVHATFLLLPLLVILQGGSDAGGPSVTSQVLLIMAVFCCVVLHELGHSLMAMRFGVRIKDIVLLPIGGVARMESIPEDPKKEVAIALAGPAVSLFLAGMFLTLAFLSNEIGGRFDLSMFSGQWFLLLFVINTMLLLFNLLPAFPLDGGRVFRGALAWGFGWPKGTRWAVIAGQAFAVLLAVTGLLLGRFWLCVIAAFIYLGGRREQRSATLRHMLSGVTASEVMDSGLQAVSPYETVGSILSRSGQAPQAAYPVVENGTIQGLLTQGGLLKAVRSSGPQTPAGQAMTRRFLTAQEGDNLADIYQMMIRTGTQVVPVARNGYIIGVVSYNRLADVFRRNNILTPR
jgi:stage IV sporulation protein FB